MLTTNSDLQRERVKAIMAATFAIVEAIREAGQIPDGILYTMVMSKMDLPTYQAVMTIILDSGVVTKSNHMLTWVGPKSAPTTKG